MLIATRCRKDETPECPEEKVRERRPSSVPGVVAMEPDEAAMADELDKICGDCDDFDPIFKKPDKRIAHACDLANSPDCLHEAEVSRLYYRDLSQVESLDGLCRPCRKFHPPPS